MSPLQYRTASFLISSRKKKKRRRDDNRPDLNPDIEQGKQNFCDTPLPFHGHSRYQDILFAFTRPRDSLGKSVLSILLRLASALRGWNVSNQPAGRKLEICHEFRLLSIHPRPHRRLASLKGLSKDFSTSIVDEIGGTRLGSIAFP